MAEIVNYRDIILQGASQRLAETTMSAGIVVKQDQVDGLGLVVLDTKLVMLSATSQIFRIPKPGSGVVQPASIALTPTVKSLPNNVVFAVIAGSAQLSLANGGALLQFDNMLTDTVTIRASVSDGSKVYFDDISISKVREGEDALTGMLTNESHTVPADHLNNALNLNGAEGFFKVYLGSTDVSSSCSFSVVSATVGASVSINLQGKYILDAMPSGPQSVSVTFRAAYGNNSIEKTFTVAKTRQGQPGAAGIGSRGSMTFYQEVDNPAWSDTVANTIVQTAVGGRVLNDVVTLYNNSAGWSETRFWEGVTWVRINAVIDGNLLVKGTVGAEKISANAITAEKLAVGAITASSAAIASLDASKLTAGFLSGDRIRANTIESGMILSESCTSLDVVVRSAGNGWQSFDFFMPHAGMAQAIAVVNPAPYSGAPENSTQSVVLNIDGQNADNQSSFFSLEVSFTLMTGLFLQQGWHKANVYCNSPVPPSPVLFHNFRVALFRRYK